MVEFDTSAVVHLHASRRVHLDLDVADDALSGEQLGWLGPRSSDAASAATRRSFRCDLRLPVHAVGHEIVFHKAALVDLGPIQRVDDHLSIDISWRSASLAPLFPVFAGQLTVTSGTVALDGWYAPPAGRIGVAFDRMLLGIAARRTAMWFLGRMADALSGETTDGAN